MGTLLLMLVSALIAPSQVFASIGSVFPSTGFTAPIPGFPSATFPLLQYDGSKTGKEAAKEASGDAKAASITFSNLRNFSFQNKSNNSVDEEIQSDVVTETSAILEEFESTTGAEVETNNPLLGRDEKSLIGTFPFIDQRRVSGNHRHHQHGGHTQGNRKHHEQSHRDNGQVFGEHVALSNTIELGQVKKFEVIHELAQQGGKEEVKDGRRCVNKVNLRTNQFFALDHRPYIAVKLNQYNHLGLSCRCKWNLRRADLSITTLSTNYLNLR